MTTFVSFGAPGHPDVPASQLPKTFRGAIAVSEKGKSTTATDETIGSALYGFGYCADPKYRQMTYCACVNSPVANPECIFAPCTNSANAYRNTAMQNVLDPARGGREKNCPSTVNCTQVFNMGGSSNIASGVSQTMNCGGVVETFITNIQAHPFLAIVVLVLILSVVMLVSGPRARAAKAPKTLPPPQLVLPESL